MKPDKVTFITRRIANANKALKEVDILVEDELWNLAVNRLYYACFYAVTALLYHFDLETKTHSGAQRLFSLHFIKPGIIDREYGDLYTELMELRQDADYEDEVEYEKNDVLRLLLPVRHFIAAMERVLAD